MWLAAALPEKITTLHKVMGSINSYKTLSSLFTVIQETLGMPAVIASVGEIRDCSVAFHYYNNVEPRPVTGNNWILFNGYSHDKLMQSHLDDPFLVYNHNSPRIVSIIEGTEIRGSKVGQAFWRNDNELEISATQYKLYWLSKIANLNKHNNEQDVHRAAESSNLGRAKWAIRANTSEAGTGRITCNTESNPGYTGGAVRSRSEPGKCQMRISFRPEVGSGENRHCEPVPFGAETSEGDDGLPF